VHNHSIWLLLTWLVLELVLLLFFTS